MSQQTQSQSILITLANNVPVSPFDAFFTTKSDLYNLSVQTLGLQSVVLNYSSGGVDLKGVVVNGNRVFDAGVLGLGTVTWSMDVTKFIKNGDNSISVEVTTPLPSSYTLTANLSGQIVAANPSPPTNPSGNSNPSPSGSSGGNNNNNNQNSLQNATYAIIAIVIIVGIFAVVLFYFRRSGTKRSERQEKVGQLTYKQRLALAGRTPA